MIPQRHTLAAIAAAVAVFAASTGCRPAPHAPDPCVTAAAFAPKKADRVARAKQLLASGKKYPGGSSDFVCDILQIDWVDADTLLGADRIPIDGNNDGDHRLEPGDIVGWYHDVAYPPGAHPACTHPASTRPASTHPTEGHVAIYLGNGGETHFIEVAADGEAPRSIGDCCNQPLFKSGKY